MGDSGQVSTIQGTHLSRSWEGSERNVTLSDQISIDEGTRALRGRESVLVISLASSNVLEGVRDGED